MFQKSPAAYRSRLLPGRHSITAPITFHKTTLSDICPGSRVVLEPSGFRSTDR